MPKKDGTGPKGQGQRCRTRGPKQGQGRGRDRTNRPSGGQRSGGGKRAVQQRGQAKNWQRNENQ